MSRWERYPAYKDSGIEWIGEIPAHWEVKPGFIIYQEKNVKNEGLKEDQLLSLSYGKLIKKQISEQTGLVPESYETYQIVDPGNIVIRCTDLQNDKTSLRTAISEYRGIITSAYLNLEINQALASPKFIHYFLHTLDTTKVLYKFGKGLRQNLSFEDFKRLPIVLPPLPEQKAIAEFLDKKTEQIDRAIAAKERLITLLKERRQILIHRAVTRGLDPNAPTKDSGIEWIGEIPAHWEVRRFRHLFKFSKGLNITKEDLQDEGIPCVNYGEIHSKYGFEVVPERHSLKCVDERYLQNNPQALLKRGDFVFADTSEDIEGSGNFTYLNSDTPTFAGYHTIIAQYAGNLEANSRYLAYLFDTDAFRDQIRKKVKGVKVYSITQAILNDLFIWLPPSEEQYKIVDSIDTKLNKIDNFIKYNQNQILKIVELKASMIDSYIRGKIKVKGKL